MDPNAYRVRFSEDLQFQNNFPNLVEVENGGGGVTVGLEFLFRFGLPVLVPDGLYETPCI